MEPITTQVTWHTNTIQEVTARLRVNPDEGLTSSDAEQRLKEFGPNAIRTEESRPVLSMIVAQFNDMLIWVLIAATLISLAIGEATDAVVIMAIVVLNAILGVAQEYRAEQSLTALKKMAAPLARVRRDGAPVDIPAEQVVPGDVLLLESGNVVAADARLIESASVKADESALTGESEPVDKSTEVVSDPRAGVGDRVNMVHSGCAITFGRGTAVAVATGGGTEMGRIATMLEGVDSEQTPLQKKLAHLGKVLAVLVAVVCVIVFFAGVMHDQPPGEMFLTAVALAVAAIPEGLPAVVTIVLAVGMRNMVKRNALIRRLQAVETLGATTVICTDKTGTLTRNQMTVRRWWTFSGQGSVTGEGYAPDGEIMRNGQPLDPRSRPDLDLLMRSAVLCNDANLRQEPTGWTAIGDPTEAALLTAAAKGGWSRDEAEREWPRADEIPFDSGRKRMTTIHNVDGKVFAIVKGAPDMIRPLCSHVLVGSTIEPMTEQHSADIAAAGRSMAGDALRIMGFAIRELPSLPTSPQPKDVEVGLTFIGLMGMIDPPRTEAAEAITRCLSAGIRPVMITGDYSVTAGAVARELGMGHGRVVEGRQLDSMNEAELTATANEASVFARVSPDDKLKIVSAMKKSGEIVAMTGDGVNDAPALKRADIGVAMGITGTDVAKGASEMVLTDDNFASIVAAVDEGRTVFANIRKSVFYLLSCNISEVLTLFTAIMIGWAAPLIPVQILWVNLVTDGLPALALGVDPAEPDVMRRPPRHPSEGVLDRETVVGIIWYGLFIALAVLLSFGFVMANHGTDNTEFARTAAFLTLSFSQLVHAFNCRSNTQSIFSLGFLSNPKLVIAVVISGLLQLAAVYAPVFHDIFSTRSLKGMDLLVVVVLSLSPLVFGELRKALRRGFSGRPAPVR